MSLLRLNNIGKIYDSNNILTIGLRNINLEFDFNEFVTIEGESGSGKSTLLNVIGANDTYEEGEMYLNGCETSHFTKAEWESYRQKYIATIFQDFNIIENLTVVENIELALLRIEDKKIRRKKALELIKKVGLINQYNQKGSKLSGGEKQRTVIARALAKDAPIILADEPTGALDVKSSREIAKLLKDVSQDKLIIVVTHNPEFFSDYATRRVTIFDGNVKEDNVIEKKNSEVKKEIFDSINSRKKVLRDTINIGTLNYKSRPKFTTMMSFALLVCAITLFIILSLVKSTLIKPITTFIDDVPISGKVIVLNDKGLFTEEELDETSNITNAGFYLLDNTYSEFKVNISKKSGMISSYQVNCVYSPYQYNLKKGNAVLEIPRSYLKDKDKIINVFKNANVGIDNISVKTTLTNNDVMLYLSHYDVTNNGVKIKSINTTMKLGELEVNVYAFESSDLLNQGEIMLINSNTYQATKYKAIFSLDSTRLYDIIDDSLIDETKSGLIVKLSEEDYKKVFETPITTSNQSALYFENDKLAMKYLDNLPTGVMGMLSNSKVYVNNAGEIYEMNIIYYISLIMICILLAALISVIFSRSVKVFQTDYAVYRTLGISNKISSLSLHVQMTLIFLPTIILLPLISLITVLIPNLNIGFITIGDYLFIEIMLLLIVQFVAFTFNKSINSQSIRKTLRRGIKG